LHSLVRKLNCSVPSEEEVARAGLEAVGHLGTGKDIFSSKAIPFPSPDCAGEFTPSARGGKTHRAPMKPKTVHVAHDKTHTPPWEVYYYEGGKKVRLARAETKSQATALASKYHDARTKRGTETPVLTSAQVDEYLRAKKALGADRSLDSVVAYYLGHAQKPSVELKVAIDGFLAELEGRTLADVSVSDYRGKLNALSAAFPTANVEFFAQPPGPDGHVLYQFILGVSENAQTRVHYRTKIGTFLRWCESRNWLSQHPNKWIKLGRVCREPPRVYTPQQTEALLRQFEKDCPRLLPFVALQAFGGLRPSEAARQTVERIVFAEGRLLVSH
jgi:hypothetical protein